MVLMGWLMQGFRGISTRTSWGLCFRVSTSLQQVENGMERASCISSYAVAVLQMDSVRMLARKLTHTPSRSCDGASGRQSLHWQAVTTLGVIGRLGGTGWARPLLLILLSTLFCCAVLQVDIFLNILACTFKRTVPLAVITRSVDVDGYCQQLRSVWERSNRHLLVLERALDTNHLKPNRLKGQVVALF